MRIKHLFLFGVILLLAACQKEETPVQPTPTVDNFQVEQEFISGDEAEDAIVHLDEVFNPTNLKLGKINLPFSKSLIDKKTIVKVKDPETGYVNYTFAVKRKKKDNFLFQIAVTKYSKNHFSDPYVFKLQFDDAFRKNLNKGKANWKDYNWPIYPYSLSATADELQKNLPCPPIDPSPSSGGSGSPGGSPGSGTTSSGSATSSGSSSDGTGTPDGCIYYTIQPEEPVCGSCTDIDTNPVVVIDCPGVEPFTIGFTDYDDCPNPLMAPIGINDPDRTEDPEETLEFTAINVMAELGISSNEVKLALLKNPDVLISIKNILQSNLSDSQKSEQLFDAWLPIWPQNIIKEKVREVEVVYAALKQMRSSGNLRYAGKKDYQLLGIALKETLSQALHTALDIIGFVPVFGEAADLLNGVLYIIEGDKTNATLSFASAIPGADIFTKGAKYGGIAIKAAANNLIVLKIVIDKKTIKFVNEAGEEIVNEFGARSGLRTVLNITDKNAEAHHLIPWKLWSHPAIQKAAKDAKKPFHMNHHKNGMELQKFRKNLDNSGVHANHPKYNNAVELLLDDLDLNDPKLAEKVINIQNDLRLLIESNKGVKINDLF